MPTAERVREVRERLFADGAVVARADGGRRDLFPVAIGMAEGLALLEWVLGHAPRHGSDAPARLTSSPYKSM